MSESRNYYRITPAAMTSFLAALLDDKYTVLAESEDGMDWKAVSAPAGWVSKSDRQPSALSFKQQVFPKSEPVFFYKNTPDGVVLIDPPADYPKTVIFGARPCDARSTDILSHVFNWDYKDEFFNARAVSTVRIGMTCMYMDEQCFCTSVGLSPSSTKGSDLFLHKAENGDHLLEVITEHGQRFIEAYLPLFGAPAPAEINAPAGPPKRFNAEDVREWIAGHFEDPFWSTLGELCLGCAQCAFACPVCHCFDIVDETDTYTEGRRMKNWDACQPGLFTKHASGHNPRDTQAKRYRQRVSHKFSYYPERFGEVLCTGCGRCTRGCAVGMDIGAIAARIGDMAASRV